MASDKRNLAGTIPGWFTVLLLAVLTWMMKVWIDDQRALLRSHENRIQSIELWRAGVEAKGRP